MGTRKEEREYRSGEEDKRELRRFKQPGEGFQRKGGASGPRAEEVKPGKGGAGDTASSIHWEPLWIAVSPEYQGQGLVCGASVRK